MTSLALAFDLLVNDAATRKFDELGNAVGRTGGRVDELGQKGRKVGDDVEHGASKGSNAMRLLSSTISGSSAGALGPLQEIADKFDVIAVAGEQATTKLGSRLLGLGAAGLGVGSFLSVLASRDEEAQKRLQAAVEASGFAYEDYAAQVELAVKSGEHFGNQAAVTLDALNRLTVTTHSPEEALKGLSVAVDVSAAKQISLAKAAELVGLTFNGSTKAAKKFGLDLVDTKKAATDLTTAQDKLKTSGAGLRDAQQAYNEKLAIYRQSVTPTLGQAFALKGAHDKVAEAQRLNRDALLRLRDAQLTANAATHAGEDNVNKLAAAVKGQGEASTDSFAGHLRSLRARIEDTAASLGHDFGGAINTASSIATVAGVAIELKLGAKFVGLMGKLGLTGTAFKTFRDIQVVTSAQGAAAVTSAAATEAFALKGLGVTAVDTALKVKAALAGLGTFGVLAAGVTVAFNEATARNALDKNLSNGTKLIKEQLASATSYREFLDAQKVALKSAADLGVRPGDKPGSFIFNPGVDRDKSGAGMQILQALADTALAFTPRPVSGDDNPHHQPIAGKAGVGRPKPGTAGDQSLADFLKSIGAGGVPNALADHLSKAGKHAGSTAAQAAAKAYADGLRKQIAADKALETSIGKSIDNIKSKIASLRDTQRTFTDFRNSIADGALSFASLGNLNQLEGQDAGGVAQLMRGRFEQTKWLQDTLDRLKSLGLGKGLLTQIAQGGYNPGLISALSNATPDQVKQINLEQSALEKQAGALGDSALINQFGTEPQKTNAQLALLNGQAKAQTDRLSSIDRNIAILDQKIAAVMNGVASTASRQGSARVSR